MLEPLIKLKIENQRRSMRLRQVDERLMELDRLREHLARFSETHWVHSRTLNSLYKLGSEKNFSSTEEHEKVKCEPELLTNPVNPKDEKRLSKIKSTTSGNLKSAKNSTSQGSHKIDLWPLKLSNLTRNKNSGEDLSSGNTDKSRMRSSICLTDSDLVQRQETDSVRIYHLSETNASSSNFLSVIPSTLVETDSQAKLNSSLVPIDSQVVSRRSSTTSMKQLINRKILLKELHMAANSSETKVNFGIENESESTIKKVHSILNDAEDKDEQPRSSHDDLNQSKFNLKIRQSYKGNGKLKFLNFKSLNSK